jgi:DNA-binding SARP family transcriptional activator
LDEVVLEFRVLGPLEALRDGEVVSLAGAKQQALLALLLLEGGRAVSTRRLTDGLWGGAAPATATKGLQLHVSRLRKALGSSVIETRPDGYLLATKGVSVDLTRFEELTESGRSQASAGRHGEAGRLFGEALALWRGEALEGLDEPGLAPLRARLDELRLAVQEQRVDVLLASGEHTRLLPELTLLAQSQPLRERLQEQLMLALYRDGRQAEALAVYRRLRETLQQQLGLEPQPRLRSFEQAILRQDGYLDPPLERRPQRAIVAAGHEPGRLAALLAPLAHELSGELILLTPVSHGEQLAEASVLLDEQRSEVVRVAAFVTREPARQVARLAVAESAALLVLQTTRNRLEEQVLGELRQAACDVVLFVDGAGELPGSAVSVLFGGSPEDWKAVELAAALARAGSVPLRLVGVDLGGSNASSLLAHASLVVQRFAGIGTRPVLFTPGDAGSLAGAVAGGPLVAGAGEHADDRLSVSRVRLGEIGVPLLLLAPGPRPGVLAPPQTLTRFSWSLVG